MQLHETQTFQGHRCAIANDSIHAHPVVDVAVLRPHGPPLSTAVFRPPTIADVVYTLGYPKLPGLRDASVTMQHGSVTNAEVTSLEGQILFLYSAISRPGNNAVAVVVPRVRRIAVRTGCSRWVAHRQRRPTHYRVCTNSKKTARSVQGLVTSVYDALLDW